MKKFKLTNYFSLHNLCNVGRAIFEMLNPVQKLIKSLIQTTEIRISYKYNSEIDFQYCAVLLFEMLNRKFQ